jgi:hypothetical protein
VKKINYWLAFGIIGGAIGGFLYGISDNIFYTVIFSTIGITVSIFIDYFIAPIPKKNHLTAKMKRKSNVPVFVGGSIFSILGLFALISGETLIGFAS